MNWPRKIVLSFCVLSVLLISAITYPTNAVLQPYHFIGKVESISEDTITIETKEGINSSDEQDWDITSGLLEGEAPNEDFQGEISSGDWVEVGSLGEPENFVVIAKVKRNSEAVITNIYGDPRFLKEPGFPWLEDYTITYENQPDCSSCEDSTCEAESTLVSIEGSDQAKEVELKPGEKYMSKALTLEFNSGETSASKCSEEAAMGPQPVSDFTVKLFSPGNWVKDKPNPEQIYIDVITLNDTSYATIKIELGIIYFRLNWKPIEKSDSRFTANCKIYIRSGILPQVASPPVTKTYELTGVASGQYEFQFNVWGEKIKTKSFQAPSPIDWEGAQLLPNPVSSSPVQLDLGQFGIPVDSFSLKVFDLSNRKVLEKSYSDGKGTLSLAGISNGLYLYSITVTYGEHTIKSPVKKLVIAC